MKPYAQNSRDIQPIRLGRAVKWHTKYARQNGVHSSPSFAINGLLNDAMSSGQSIEEWAQLLELNIET